MEDVYNMVRRQVALYRAYDARQQQEQRAGRGKQGGPLNYDLTINTAELSIEAASELVIAGLERKLGVKPKGK
jgi:hypothetical protein